MVDCIYTHIYIYTYLFICVCTNPPPDEFLFLLGFCLFLLFFHVPLPGGGVCGGEGDLTSV